MPPTKRRTATKKSTKSSSAMGKKKTSKNKKEGDKVIQSILKGPNLPYDVKILMCVREPFVRRSPPVWKEIKGMAGLEIELIKYW